MREMDLAFIRLHILYHASKEKVYGVGIVKELARHGCKLSFGTHWPGDLVISYYLGLFWAAFLIRFARLI